jgi:aminoglycoside 6'-N-acetyltransferase I
MRPRLEPLQFILRPVIPDDAATWEALRCAHWPDGAADHGPEIASFFAGTLPEPQAVLMAVLPSGEIVGFTELSIRTDLPGAESKKTGYVEGLYIRPEFRGRGLARQFLIAARNWAREQGCTAFASDRAGRLIICRSF